MDANLVTNLLPVLSRSLEKGFNLFDVMHHGTHEKQLSNIFAWLLDIGGTHQLGDQFVRIFIREVNKAEGFQGLLSTERYTVRQEVNMGWDSEPDIADLVLESDTTRIVIENYFTSDGHGHGYERYLAYSAGDGRRGRVVLLCRDEERSRLSDGWEKAAVVTYSALIDKLYAGLSPHFVNENPDVHFFIQQLHRQFVAERNMVGDQEVLEFVTALTQAGEAKRYAKVPHISTAEQFASDVTVQARQRFVEGREMLQRLKQQLRRYSGDSLASQLETKLGPGSVQQVSAALQGIYQWTVVLDLRLRDGSSGQVTILLLFGPSAHLVTQDDSRWKQLSGQEPDYSKLYVARQDTLVALQSDVSLSEILEGLTEADFRLRDEILRLLDFDERSHATGRLRADDKK